LFAALVLFGSIAIPARGQTDQGAPTRPQLELLFSQDDIPRIRANAQLPLFADFWRSQLELDVTTDNNVFREAFIYAVTADPARGESAKRVVLETAELEYWHNFVQGDLPLGFLTAGRLTAWMSLAYDWLYDIMSEAEREQVRNAIAEKGCAPLYRALYGFKYPDETSGWAFAPHATNNLGEIDMSRWPTILANNNFRAIINGGLTLGSIVLDGHDDRAPEWQEIALESIGLFNDRLQDDGSYDEAVAYLNYAMTYQLHAMEGARRKLGRDYFDTANFQGMIDYVLAMYLPSDLYGNGSMTFGDAGNSLQSPSVYWVARNARDKQAQYVANNYSDHDLLSLLYYDETVTAEAPTDDGFFAELDLDWIISRSGYDADDFVIGMRSGAPMNHEHGDRNSIQLKSYREILLADHRRLSYWNSDPEWVMRGSAGHNMVLIDGAGVQYHNGEEGTNESKSYAKIVRSGRRPGKLGEYHFWASDATQGYRLLNRDITSVTRTVISFPDYPAVVVLDKITKTGAPSLVSARWHAENSDGQATISVDADNGIFTISRPNARLFAKIAGTSTLTPTVGTFESLNKEHPFRFVEAQTAGGQTEVFNIMVGIPLRPGEPDPMVTINQSGETWTIQIGKNLVGGSSEVYITVSDNGPLPEFEVEERPGR
jgi:hypothetical protein